LINVSLKGFKESLGDFLARMVISACI